LVEVASSLLHFRALPKLSAALLAGVVVPVGNSLPTVEVGERFFVLAFRTSLHGSTIPGNGIACPVHP
jgi:hypothetical protein